MSSLHIHAAVDLNNLSADIRTEVGSEEEGNVSHILGLATTTKGNLLHPVLTNSIGQRSRHGRLNEMFRTQAVQKTYWALVQNAPREQEATLTHYLVRNEKQNKSYAYDHERPNAKKAVLDYKVIGHTDRYTLLEVHLHTGRHHQIRCQLAAIGCPIRGDLKYGAPRSNPDGSISLHARSIHFEHPVSHEDIYVEAPAPTEGPWGGVRSEE